MTIGGFKVVALHARDSRTEFHRFLGEKDEWIPPFSPIRIRRFGTRSDAETVAAEKRKDQKWRIVVRPFDDD